jgi:light-regulated signal transduction histidine kinase (bacteriophytochrome)
MGTSDRSRAEDEIESLRKALDGETHERLEVQRQLDRANAEFEEFVSTAAHNLRESLRDVAAYSQLMSEAYAGRLDSDAGVFLDRIQQGAARMQSLLADIVDYWAVDTADRQPARADMEAVLRQALLSVDKQITERGAMVTHDPLPPVWGDFEILSKVLQHLLRNAVEYGCPSTPRVHISSRWVEPDWEFSVRDNGAGIDPEFQGHLFGAIKRLHGKEHPGNGLGLAFCKKVIERQGGRMWMESSAGAGSTFYFTLPPAE